MRIFQSIITSPFILLNTSRCPFFNREKRRKSLELESSQLFEFLKQSTSLLDKSSPQVTFSLQNTIGANFFRQRCV